MTSQRRASSNDGTRLNDGEQTSCQARHNIVRSRDDNKNSMRSECAWVCPVEEGDDDARVHAGDQRRFEQTHRDTSRASSEIQVCQSTTTRRSTSHADKDLRARKQNEQERYQRADKHCGATNLNRSHEVVLSIATPVADHRPPTSNRCARRPDL